MSKIYIKAVALLVLSYLNGFSATTVFIMAGQSNMDGRADISGFDTSMQSPLNTVDYYYGNDPGGSDDNPTGVLTTVRGSTSETGGTGPTVPMAHYIRTNSSVDVAFIKYANGGSGFSDGRWSAGGDSTATGDGLDYRRLQNIVISGLSALQTANPSETYIVGGFVWIQGERDAVQSASTAAYQANLTDFIADLRATYGSDLPFIYSGLSDNQISIDSAALTNIQTAQDNVNSIVDNTYLLNTDSSDFSMSTDNLHFDADGYTALGEGLGQLALNSIPEPSSVTLLGLSGLALILRRRR